MQAARVSDSAAAELTNFTLLRPDHPDVFYDRAAISIRHELGPGVAALHLSESSWSAMHSLSAHYVLRTELGAVRVKQYLFDWGPLSSIDHAALYDHRPADMRVHCIDETRVAWSGWDYERHRAVTMLGWGTNVELRDLSGDEPTELLLDVAASFRPVSEDESLASMASRSYWSRWPRYDLNMISAPGYRIPSSLWHWRWPWLEQSHEWVPGMADPAAGGTTRIVAEAFAPSWEVDSTCVFGDVSSPSEIQVLFRPTSRRGNTQLWFRQFAADRGGIRRPQGSEWPLTERLGGPRPQHTRLVLDSGIEAFCISETIAFGPHDLVWWEGDYGYLMQVSAAADHDRASAIELFRTAVGGEVLTSSLREHSY